MYKKKILFVLPQLNAGGSERVVYDLVRSLYTDTFEVFVIAFSGGVLVDPLKALCKDVCIIQKKKGIDVSAMVTLSSFIKKHNIDVVNAHHYMPCFYSFLGAKVLNSKTLIYTEHSVPEVESIINCFHRKILDWMLYAIDGVVGVSKEITGIFKKYYSQHANKIHEILNGVDVKKFQLKDARAAIRSDWGVSDNAFIVGTVANFRKVKNHACLVRAAGRLKNTYPHLRLFFVGTGFSGDPMNSEDEVRTLVGELGLQDKVLFAGYQDDIPRILSAFDAFCLPSFSEGLPVCLLEAMAAGLPVVGSEVAGIVEVIKDGKTGFLFSSDNDLELANVLETILENPSNAKALADNALTFVKDVHGFQSWRRKYFEILMV